MYLAQSCKSLNRLSPNLEQNTFRDIKQILMGREIQSLVRVGMMRQQMAASCISELQAYPLDNSKVGEMSLDSALKYFRYLQLGKYLNSLSG